MYDARFRFRGSNYPSKTRVNRIGSIYKHTPVKSILATHVKAGLIVLSIDHDLGNKGRYPNKVFPFALEKISKRLVHNLYSALRVSLGIFVVHLVFANQNDAASRTFMSAPVEFVQDEM
ncbi:hypothetical protein CPB84DRAFT_1746305 [Gymnopilus junonius]|uniref:Uncharacterized protein n=1 Tax=Gymnopilus junonius TaxID=109634 RepID=A0A9P5TPV0_GYMJU|nr:hypothetical protein CPB84DRAFT_1746305 [Gymnopilus junonius]